MLGAPTVEMGCGNYLYSAGEGFVYTFTACDLGRGPVVYTPKIFSASHIFDHTSPTNSIFRFYANFYDTTASTVTATVTVAGTSYPMTLESGSANKGTYTTANFTIGNGCRQYFFTINGERHPSDGFFDTYGETGCTTSYEPGTVVTTVAPNPATATSSTSGSVSGASGSSGVSGVSGTSGVSGASGNSATGNSATGNSATGNSATGNSATGNSATGNSATGNSATGNSATGNSATGNAATGSSGSTAKSAAGQVQASLALMLCLIMSLFM